MKDKNSKDLIIQVNEPNIIGSNISELRKELNLKQTDVVKALQLDGLDISIYTYNRIEHGTQNPTVIFLIKIIKILHCDMNRLFEIK